MNPDMGQVFTFYSYKGGVGRSMALANVGALLSHWGYKTLIVDWDLEAPGIENYFQPHLGEEKISLKGGVVDLLEEARRRAPEEPGKLPWRDYVVRLKLLSERDGELKPWGERGGALDLLGAGVVNDNYFRRLRNFDLDEFYLEQRGGYAIEALRDEWRHAYDFILIDSRTGVTDIGGVCTIQFPDVLVMLFTSNMQNVAGTLTTGTGAVKARRELPLDRVKLLTIPVASRFDADNEFELSEEMLERAAERLAPLYEDWLPPDVTPLEALGLTLIPYRAYFSFGEQLAVVREETVTNSSLSYTYETLAALLIHGPSTVEQLRSNRDTFVKLAVQVRTEPGPRPAAFLSYAHADDRYGHITAFCQRLGDELQMQTGTEFPIFLDRKDIRWGDNWRQRIEDSLDDATFLIPIITPSFFNSQYCREELQRFLEREKRLGRNDLITPVYFVDTPLVNEEDLRATDELAQALAYRQYVDWRELRYEPAANPLVGRTLERIARRIRDALPRAGTHRPPRATDEKQRSLLIMRDGREPLVQRPPVTNEPPTCTVNPMPRRGDFTTIGEAIEKAEPGTKIIVQPGFYQEGLVINKPLEIIGEGEPGEVVVQASGTSVIIFQTTLGRVTNLTLRQAGGGDWAAVYISQGRLELEDCDITCRGISCVLISNGADPRLRRNRIHNTVFGVVVTDNGLGTLEENDIFGTADYSVLIEMGGNPALRRNRIRDGEHAGLVIGVRGLGTAEDNDISGNSFAGVIIKQGARPFLRHNRITHNRGVGIRVEAGGGGVIEGNDLRDNRDGSLLIADSDLSNLLMSDNVEL